MDSLPATSGAGYSKKKVKIEESQQMWAIEDSPGPKAAYRGGWYHFTSGYTTDGKRIYKITEA